MNIMNNLQRFINHLLVCQLKIFKLTILILIYMVVEISFWCNLSAQFSADSLWKKEKATQWFKSNNWSNGLKIRPHESIDVVEFANQYHKNKNYWDLAFSFLSNSKLDTLHPGKYNLDGDNVFISVTEGPTRDFDSTGWEAHRKYADIHYVIKGEEKIGVAVISKATVIKPFNEKKDIGTYKVLMSDARFYKARPDVFFIFFPTDVHRPGIKVNEGNTDKKIVVKVKIDTLLISNSQIIVGLDHWFNHKTNPVTGKPFHYLWSDSAYTGYSQWGTIFTKKGARIATIDRPEEKTMHGLNVYIIVDPDSTQVNPSPHYIENEDVNTIERWVKQGGVLVLLGNDPANCEFTHLNQLSERFGITFNHRTFHQVVNDQWETGAFDSLPKHTLFKGVNKIYLKGISSLSVKSPAKAVLTQKGQIFMAECNYGKGYVFAVGDPWLYNEYIGHLRLPGEFDNLRAAENLTDLLLIHAKASFK